MKKQVDAGKVRFAVRVRKPPRRPRSPLPPLEALIQARASAWKAAIEPTTRRAYERALKSWNIFALAFSFPSFPTAHSLSLWVMHRQLKATHNTVINELSGLAYFFSSSDATAWKLARFSMEVKRALDGGAKLYPHQVVKARPLDIDSLVRAVHRLDLPRTSYDDLLWAAMLIVGFFTCGRAIDIATSDDPTARDPRKLAKRDTVVMSANGFAVTLPYHKGDRFYNGFRMWFARADAGGLLDVVRLYLKVRDRLFGSSGFLFIKQDGSSPLRRWFVERLHWRCGREFSGHSLRAGGATWYAKRGLSEPDIKRLGRWSSEEWIRYIRMQPETLIAQRTIAATGRSAIVPPAHFDSRAFRHLL